MPSSFKCVPFHFCGEKEQKWQRFGDIHNLKEVICANVSSFNILTSAIFTLNVSFDIYIHKKRLFVVRIYFEWLLHRRKLFIFHFIFHRFPQSRIITYRNVNVKRSRLKCQLRGTYQLYCSELCYTVLQQQPIISFAIAYHDYNRKNKSKRRIAEKHQNLSTTRDSTIGILARFVSSTRREKMAPIDRAFNYRPNYPAIFCT